MASLADAIQQDITRVRNLQDQYKTIPEGFFGQAVMEEVIQRAIKALAENDAVACLQVYHDLQEISG